MGTITITEMQRDYIKEYSPSLGREMEILHFGHAGRPLLVFPTSMGRFYQWEDFGLVGGLSDYIESGGRPLISAGGGAGGRRRPRARAPPHRARARPQRGTHLP